eukprot:6178106-Pleurochrysis_carterae.AAC.2
MALFSDRNHKHRSGCVVMPARRGVGPGVKESAGSLGSRCVKPAPTVRDLSLARVHPGMLAHGARCAKLFGRTQTARRPSPPSASNWPRTPAQGNRRSMRRWSRLATRCADEDTRKHADAS